MALAAAYDHAPVVELLLNRLEARAAATSASANSVTGGGVCETTTATALPPPSAVSVSVAAEAGMVPATAVGPQAAQPIGPLVARVRSAGASIGGGGGGGGGGMGMGMGMLRNIVADELDGSVRCAASEGAVGTLRLLLSHALVRRRVSAGRVSQLAVIALVAAARGGRLAATELVLDCHAGASKVDVAETDEGLSAVDAAARYGQLEVLHLLLKRSAAIDEYARAQPPPPSQPSQPPPPSQPSQPSRPPLPSQPSAADADSTSKPALRVRRAFEYVMTLPALGRDSGCIRVAQYLSQHPQLRCTPVMATVLLRVLCRLADSAHNATGLGLGAAGVSPSGRVRMARALMAMGGRPTARSAEAEEREEASALQLAEGLEDEELLAALREGARAEQKEEEAPDPLAVLKARTPHVGIYTACAYVYSSQLLPSNA